MNDVEKSSLMDYLENAITLERNVFEQDKIIELFTRTSLSRQPKVTPAKVPAQPTYKSVPKLSKLSMIGHALFFCVGLALIIIGLIQAAEGNRSAPIGWGTGIFIALIGAFFVLVDIGNINSVKRIKEANEKLQKQYLQNCERVKNENKAQQDATTKNYPIWQQSHNSTLTQMRTQRAKTKRILEEVYKQSPIFEKYWTFPAVTSIYEYFKSGRCKELTDAYNKYDNELFQQTILDKMDIIILNLEQIKTYQFMLYKQVTSVKDELSRIENELSKISGYTYGIAQLTALNTYYSALNATNTSIMAFYHIA